MTDTFHLEDGKWTHFKIHHRFSCTLGQSTMIHFMKKKKKKHLKVDNTADQIKLSKIEKHICYILTALNMGEAVVKSVS